MTLNKNDAEDKRPSNQIFFLIIPYLQSAAKQKTGFSACFFKIMAREKFH
jgi:hypothetical protein